MDAIVVPVVPRASAAPADIAQAASSLGLSPVFVTRAESIDQQHEDAVQPHGPLMAYDPDDLDPLVSRLAMARPVAVVTYSESTLTMAQTLAESLRLPFYSRETVTFLTDKWAQRQKLAQAGVDSLRSSRVSSRQQLLGELSLRNESSVVKPLLGQSSRDTFLVAPRDIAPEQLEPTEERPFVIEDFLRGRDEGDFGNYVSVETLFLAGRPWTLGVTSKFPQLPPFREQGQMAPSHLDAHEATRVTRLAEDAAAALGVSTGLTHVEVKLTDQGPRIIEVNGRMGGYLVDLYERLAGIDMLQLAMGASTGRTQRLNDTPSSGRVEFQYFNSPPVEGGVLTELTNAHYPATVPGIVDYEVRVPPGSHVSPSVMTSLLDFLRGSVTDHESVFTTIDRALEPLRFTFRDSHGVKTSFRCSRNGLQAG